MTAVLRLVRDDGSDGHLPPIEAYELYLRAGNRSDRYIADSMITLNRLAVQARKPVERCTPVDVSRFLASPRYSPGTRCAYFSHIRGFFRWWAIEGGIDITCRLARPKAPRRQPRPVSDAGLRQLFDTTMHHRTRVMILLAVLGGLRVHEIAKFRGEDVDLDAATIRVTGKGGRTDTLPLHPKIAAEAAHTMPRRGWWFPANARRKGDHVHSKSVSSIIGNAMRRAGVPGTPHSLRHWYGTNLVATGTDLRTTQTLLRHTNLQTTAIYVQVADQKRAEAIERLQPPLPSQAEQTQNILNRQHDRCRQSILRTLGGLDPHSQMPHTKLSQALKSDIRPHLDTAISELENEGLVATATTTRGRAYRLRSGTSRRLATKREALIPSPSTSPGTDHRKTTPPHTSQKT